MSSSARALNESSTEVCERASCLRIARMLRLAAAPNPSIERTVAGKPVSFARVEL
jgi:hypothetical protein